MKSARTWVFSALIVLFISENLRAAVPVCEEPPSFADGKKFETIDASHLPERVFVARSVELWASHKERGMKLLARHDFKTMKSEVRCSKAPFEGSLNVTALVPALLDLSHDKKWGDSVWQVQALSQAKRVGIWSQKSRLAPTDEAKKIMQRGTWRSLSGDSFELIWDQDVDGTHMVFRAVFDLMNP